MAPHKSNLAEKQPSLQYVVVPWAIDENVGRVEWRGVTDHDANSLATDNLTPHEKTRLEEAREFLYEELKDAPMWARQIYRDANDAGIARRTLESAKSHMRIRSEKIGTEGWQWSLPEKEGRKEGTEEEEDREKDIHHDVRDVRDVHDVQNANRPNPAKNKEGREGREGRNGVEDRDVQRDVPLVADEDDEDRQPHDEDRQPQRSPQELREIAEELGELMNKHTKAAKERKKKLKAILVEQGESHNMDTDQDRSTDTQKIEALLLSPPPWLQNQLVRYSEDVDSFREPTCRAVAAKALGAPDRWEEVVPILQGTS